MCIDASILAKDLISDLDKHAKFISEIDFNKNDKNL
jgi:hypothetical protein